MKKREIKQCIQIYSKIEWALIERRTSVEIKQNGCKKSVTIFSWMYRLPEIIRQIKNTEKNDFIGIMIEENIRSGEKDRIVMRDIPVSESTYYRWKSQLIDKIFTIFALSGEVTLEEILAESIE